MIRERIVAIWEYKKLTAKKLEELSGIDREKWYALRKGAPRKRRRHRVDGEDPSAVRPLACERPDSSRVRPDKPRIRRSQSKLARSERGIAITKEVARRWYARRQWQDD